MFLGTVSFPDRRCCQGTLDLEFQTTGESQRFPRPLFVMVNQGGPPRLQWLEFAVFQWSSYRKQTEKMYMKGNDFDGVSCVRRACVCVCLCGVVMGHWVVLGGGRKMKT